MEFFAKMSALDELLLRKYRESVIDPPSRLSTQETPSDPEPEVPQTDGHRADDALNEPPPEETAEPAEGVTVKQPSDETPEQSVKVPSSFTPDWEVDRFLWPEICGEVEKRIATLEHL
jgi:hypothetical protein